MRRFVALAQLALLSSGCGASTAVQRPPEPLEVSPSTPAVRGASPDPELRSFRENVARAQEEADRAGWVAKETVEVEGRHVAVLIYEPKPERAPATRVAKVQVVGSGAYQVVSAESGMIELVRTKRGEQLWDLRGDGPRYLVLHLTPCGAYCGVAKPLVVDTAGDHPKVESNAPVCPTCGHDEDGDGAPEFDVRLASLRVAPCSRVSCGPAGALLVEVRGLEVWDGSRYSRDLQKLAPLYARRLERAQNDAIRVRRAKNKSRICPLNPLQVAARLYVFSRLSGESRADALERTDEVMRGYRFEPCSKEYDLLAPPRDFGELRREMERWELPRLERTPPR